MAEETIAQKEIQRIKNLNGQARGQTMKNALQAILIMEGEKGMLLLKKKMEELGCWSEEYNDYNRIRSFSWFPLWQDVSIIVIAADLFGWDEKALKQFGQLNQKVSYFEKMLMKYFVSLRQVFDSIPERWRKHYSVGNLIPIEFEEKKQYAVFRLVDFSVHPVFCQLLQGYFESACIYVTRSEKIETEELKCTFKGDPYHEFILHW